MLHRFFATICLVLLASADAFMSPSPISARQSSALNIAELHVFDGIKEPVQAYVDIWTPFFKQAIDAGLVPSFLLKWGHGGAMGTVLLTMGVIGTIMGWQIRGGKGGEVNALTLGETIRETHPKIMGGMLFFFLLGGQGGIVLKDVQGGEILTSPHALTGAIGIALLFLQAALPLTFEAGGKTSRTLHAYLGTGTMAVFFAHMAAGIQLGNSL